MSSRYSTTINVAGARRFRVQQARPSSHGWRFLKSGVVPSNGKFVFRTKARMDGRDASSPARVKITVWWPRHGHMGDPSLDRSRTFVTNIGSNGQTRTYVEEEPVEAVVEPPLTARYSISPQVVRKEAVAPFIRKINFNTTPEFNTTGTFVADTTNTAADQALIDEQAELDAALDTVPDEGSVEVVTDEVVTDEVVTDDYMVKIPMLERLTESSPLGDYTVPVVGAVAGGVVMSVLGRKAILGLGAGAAIGLAALWNGRREGDL